MKKQCLEMAVRAEKEEITYLTIVANKEAKKRAITEMCDLIYRHRIGHRTETWTAE